MIFNSLVVGRKIMTYSFREGETLPRVDGCTRFSPWSPCDLLFQFRYYFNISPKAPHGERVPTPSTVVDGHRKRYIQMTWWGYFFLGLKPTRCARYCPTTR
jgi:hypothetical protein